MIDAGNEAIHAIRGRSPQDLDGDRLWALGLIKCVEIIGEAASHIGNETREKHADIPWNQIVSMRNRLVHVYFDIDTAQVWKTLTEDIPELMTRLQNMLDEP